MRNFVIFLILTLSMQLVMSQDIQISDPEISIDPRVSEEMDPGISKVTHSSSQEVTTEKVLNGQKEDDPKKKRSDAKKLKITKMENFLHNYMNKLERLLRPLKNKEISNRYKRLAEEYFRRLSEDTINKSSGFQMGDQTMELLDLSNYVLDSVDISEMKKAGVLKSFLLNQVKNGKSDKQGNKEKKENNNPKVMQDTANYAESETDESNNSNDSDGSWFD